MKTLKAVDLFCGAGGASTGLIRAAQELGLDVDLLAVNHWPTAVETHSLNHPRVRHLCEAVDRINPRAEVPGGRLHLLLAGPECTHHSTAAGGRPRNEQSRASAWHILKWAQELYIDTILIENVPEFRSWGPLGANGKPLKSRKGQTYRAFLEALRSLGYRVEEKVLNAADYGDPTTRRRLFILARRGRHTVSWPAATHSRTGAPTLFGTTQKWRAAREVIDWSIQGRSIFGRKKPLKPATMARILAGLEKFGGPELRPFLVILRNHMAGRSIDVPLPTIAAQGQHVGVCEPFLMHITHGRDVDRTRSLDTPLPTITTAKRGEIGIVEPFVLQQQSNGAPRSTDDPLPTIATAGRQSLIQAFVLQQQSGGVPRSTEEPLPTVATDGAIAVVQPYLVQTSERRDERVDSVEDPMRTITATGGRCFGLAQPFIVPYHGEKDGERTPRVHDIDDPLKTQTCENRFGLCEPFLVPMYGERDGQDPRTHSVSEPVPTIPATGGGKFGVVEPFVISAGGANLRQPRAASDPLPTVLGSDRLAVVEPFIFANRTHNAPKSLDEPVPPLCTGDHIAVVEPFLTKYYGTAVGAQSVDEPIDTITATDRFGLVMPVINGYVLDIRFRMLQPHELAAATSFPRTYVFQGTREDVVKQIGNAWPGELAKALCLSVTRDYLPGRKRRSRAA